jgi:hypothetical protein
LHDRGLNCLESNGREPDDRELHDHGLHGRELDGRDLDDRDLNDSDSDDRSLDCSDLVDRNFNAPQVRSRSRPFGYRQCSGQRRKAQPNHSKDQAPLKSSGK